MYGNEDDQDWKTAVVTYHDNTGGGYTRLCA